ncbi:MAG: hypothetical protein IT424_12125 [Pirellulales bacterium]|nr:hypothetical protein [Pirellulales bacterium]
MPEGDTIFRSATTLRSALVGGVIEAARIRDRQFECERITGSTVGAVEARGKHLLMHLAPPPSKGAARGRICSETEAGANGEPPRSHAGLAVTRPHEGVAQGGRDALATAALGDDGEPPVAKASRPLSGAAQLILHSHMGMTGSWHVYHPGDAWRKPEHYAALVLRISGLDVICFSPRLLELLTADQLRRHRHLRRLGPDLLDPQFDHAEALQRLRGQDRLPLGEAVMNQTLVAGIGNIYKSEVLFLMGFDPFAPVGSFSDEELAAMLQKARYLLRRNSGGPRRTTRFGSDAGRMWIYGKSGQPCPKCGATIRLRRQGDAGRTTCWCPQCQPRRAGGDARL